MSYGVRSSLDQEGMDSERECPNNKDMPDDDDDDDDLAITVVKVAVPSKRLIISQALF